MNVMEYVITLYIRPEQGPTMPVELDMLAIETAVVNTSANLNRDMERIKAIAAKIKAEYPNVQPEARLQDLRALVTRFNQASMFDGIVLRLPGSIDGPPMPKNPAQEEFERLSREGLQMRADLQQWIDKTKELQREHTKLKAENARLESSAKSARDSLTPLQELLKNKEHETQTTLAEARQLKTQLATLQQQNAALQVQLDRAKLDQQMAARDQQEVAQLRQQVVNFKAKEQQWNDTITKRDQEIAKLRQDLADLRRELKRLLDQGAQGLSPRQSVSDEARKGPYLD